MANQMRSVATLDARLAELESDLAHFEENHGPEDSALTAQLRARQQTLRAKVRDAIQKNDAWAMIGAELTRDFDALAGEVETLILRGGEGEGAGPRTGAGDARTQS
jgi:hypothetical protein